MPKSLDPASIVKYVLKSDEAKDNPPTFKIKNPSGREYVRIMDLCSSMDDGKTNAEKVKALYDAIALALRGWENMGEFGDYEPDKLQDVLTVDEANELFDKITTVMHPSAAELGK